MRTFLLLLAAKVISNAGSQLTLFGLGVWLYERTQSATLYGLLILCIQLPTLLVSPLGGVLTDTWNRRKTLMLAHAGGGVCALLLMAVHSLDLLGPVTALLLTAVLASFTGLDAPAFSALVRTLVPREQLPRANGLVQAGIGVVQILAPLSAGFLMPAIGLSGLLTLDAISFVIYLGVLLRLRMPPQDVPARKERTAGAFLQEASGGWHYIRSHSGMSQLVLLSAAILFSISMVQVLVSPLVLSVADSRTLGIVNSMGGIGFLSGSVLMLVWRGPKRLVLGILAFALAQGAMLLFLGLAPPSLYLAAAGTFGVLFTFPITAGYTQTVWQRLVPLELQGRVTALRLMATRVATLVGFPLAGPLADRLQPLMAPGGALAPVLGPLMGTGPGRGAALVIAMAGLMTVLVTLLGFASVTLRRLEEAEPPPTPATRVAA